MPPEHRLLRIAAAGALYRIPLQQRTEQRSIAMQAPFERCLGHFSLRWGPDASRNHASPAGAAGCAVQQGQRAAVGVERGASHGVPMPAEIMHDSLAQPGGAAPAKGALR